MSNLKKVNTRKVAKLNDDFRSHPTSDKGEIHFCKRILSQYQDNEYRADAFRLKLTTAVARDVPLKGFPMHDFGVVVAEGLRLIWKIKRYKKNVSARQTVSPATYHQGCIKIPAPRTDYAGALPRNAFTSRTKESYLSAMSFT